ncbi:NADH dehydrogenase [ubiquinone] 1 beta subcomplex subunit 2 [Blattella germanica]|nr:NADH dehydrogenase [ubiquinone] 1 beta subcomplex subunit 2 [Blattella germanica]
MLISRGAGLLRCVIANAKQRPITHSLQPVRLSHDAVWSYRVPQPPQPKYIRVLAEVIGGTMWWWIFWHLWHEWGHIVGEFDYPDPSKWTDEELGIPPDDEE